MSGFVSPQYTQTPNDLFDLLMRDMEKSELKVVLAVIRKTVGFHKKVARMSIRDMQEVTGLSVNSIYAGVDAAAKRGILIKSGKGGVTEWRIQWKDEPNDHAESGVLEMPDSPTVAVPTLQQLESDSPMVETPSIKDTSKETEKEKIPEQRQKNRVAQILDGQGHDTSLGYAGWSVGSRQADFDVSDYPEEVSIQIQQLCRLWNLRPPEKKGSTKGFWIKSGREMMHCYGEFGPRLLAAIYYDLDWIDKKTGQPMTVSGPHSVLNWLSAKAGKLRTMGIRPGTQLEEYIEGAKRKFLVEAPDWLLETSSDKTATYGERQQPRKEIEAEIRARLT